MHTLESASAIAPVLQMAFPDAPPRDLPFAYDWLGRQFCARADDPGATVLLFEPGSGECFDVPVAFADFHDAALVDDGDDVLATGYFADYRAAGGAAPTVTECVGFKIPLFLGGPDDFSNLELTDMDLSAHSRGGVGGRDRFGNRLAGRLWPVLGVAASCSRDGLNRIHPRPSRSRGRYSG